MSRGKYFGIFSPDSWGGGKFTKIEFLSSILGFLSSILGFLFITLGFLLSTLWEKFWYFCQNIYPCFSVSGSDWVRIANNSETMQWIKVDKEMRVAIIHQGENADIDNNNSLGEYT